MEIFLLKVLQFMMAISLLVLLHEGGHFFFSNERSLSSHSLACTHNCASAGTRAT